jgi:hypothetical protein
MKIITNIAISFISLATASAADTLIDVPPYSRDAFGGWADSDGDCQNTRHELLIFRSLRPAELRTDGCLVLMGSWIDPYSAELQRQASEVDIDHLVPLKFAWDHGAWNWAADKMEQFANDPINLVITQKSLNRSKGSDGPLNWLPPNDEFKCAYIYNFIEVMQLYSLSLNEYETLLLNELRLTVCNAN